MRKDRTGKPAENRGREARARRLLFLIPAAVIALDRVTKAAAAGLAGPVTLIPGVIGLRYAENTGMAFSLFAGRSWLLGILTLLILSGGALAFRRLRPGTLALTGALLILGGGLSNAADRLFLGYVPDMIELLFVRFAVFNAADVSVCAGAFLCAISLLFRPQDWHGEEERNG